MLRAELQPPPSRSLVAAESDPGHEVSELENRGGGLSRDRTLGILRKCRKKAVRVSSFSNLFVFVDEVFCDLQGFDHGRHSMELIANVLIYFYSAVITDESKLQYQKPKLSYPYTTHAKRLML